MEAILWLNERLLVSPYARIQYEEYPALVAAATVLVPAIGGLLVGLLVRWAVRERRALGPPDSIMAVQTRRPPPTPASGAGSTLAALLSLGCGASVGQYGPLVYLGTLFGALAARLPLRIQDLQAIAIGCGVAAAISTAFNAPLAGVVFAHEVVLRHYSLRAFAPVTVASATGYVFANVIFERTPLFLVSFEGVAHSYEFPLFALEGVLAAGLAAGFMKLVLLSARMAQKSPIPQSLRPMVAGVILGVVALGVPEVLGIGKETLRFATIEGAFTLDELTLILIVKLAMTVLCVGFGFVGGVFSPALLIGILAGALYSVVLGIVLPVPRSALVVYAICGMMAVTSPVIGAPLTTILIVFELTRNYDLTIAAMVAVVFSNLVAYRLFGRSLFDVQLAGRGFDLSTGRDRAILDTMPVRERMTTFCTRVPPGASVGEVTSRLTADGRSEASVVDDNGRYLGIVRLQSLQQLRPDTRIGTIADTGQITFDEHTTVWTAMETMTDFVGEAVPLVARDGTFHGVVPEGAVIDAYLEAIHDLRREENAGS
ncbi:MAG: chloride channel protein [Arhodomonas sp.]|nr:chloride channel protein [Arhodomonas sp.]